MRLAILIVLATLIAGCATVPQSIQGAPERSATPAQVAEHIDAFKGQRVRWGGTIAAVRNLADSTEVAVVARPLQSDGRPEEDAASQGRFLAVVNGFLDPAVYTAGRTFTVVGTVSGIETRKVGDYSYPYPTVQVTGTHLWAPLPKATYDEPGPFWYDPWYYPWYPYPYYWHPYHRSR